MPRGDRTGPWGFGARTGRGLGYCSGFSSPGYTKGPGMGWGRGGGRGWGRGWGRAGLDIGWGRDFGPFYYPYPYSSEVVPPYPIAPPTLDPKEESKFLEQTLTSLKKEMEVIEKRLQELVEKKKE
ncbi:MAG: DUF5320 domain-containing protein [Promethearchaeota archaeon]